MIPTAAYAARRRIGSRRTSRHTRGSSASIAATRTIRHHTSGTAGSEINLPKTAVNPHSTTQM